MPEQAAQVEPSRITRQTASQEDLIAVLGVRVESLVANYREARQQVAVLDAELTERNARVRELEKKMESMIRARRGMTERIDGLIAQLERLERNQA
jgi:hypothetical protein